MEPQFAIDGPGWSVSFQRRVATANRGALPYVRLGATADPRRVLVPLRESEALWIAVMAESAIEVDGRAGEFPLRAGTLPTATDGRVLLALDAIQHGDRWLPIDSASISIADDAAATATDTVTLSLGKPGQQPRRIAIVVATPTLYETLGGLPAPGPTTAQDGYRGWRLP